jgi:elongation factor 1-alpha
MEGDNIYKKSENTKWYSGETLIETLDQTISPTKLPVNKPLRAVVQDVYPYEDNQKIIASKIVTGILKKGESIVFNPSGKKGVLQEFSAFGTTQEKAGPGGSVGLIIKGVYEVPRGEVLSHPENQPRTVRKFMAEIILLSDIYMENGDAVTIRYGTAEKKCKVQKILREIDPVKLTVSYEYPKKLKDEAVGEVEFLPLEPLCMELYSEFPELGRFVIKGKKGTAAAGIVLEIT